jgi:heme peroxidase
MDTSSAVGTHGFAGITAKGTTRLVDEKTNDGANHEPYDSPKWAALAKSMQAPPEDEIEDEPDPEENLYMPAGYTYLGQFVDHDLTFDTSSSLAPPTGPDSSTNERTPRFDLDCIYGSGPSDQPYMYDIDQATLLLGRTPGGNLDLLRTTPSDPRAARAVIGDPRNDENSIVCQLQIAFIRFHNDVVGRLKDQGLKANVFGTARNEVRWTYQRILVEDFLPRLVREDVRNDFEAQRRPDERGRSTNNDAYLLFRGPRDDIPLEFSKAVYRLGHSLVRNGYRLNAKHAPVHIFGTTEEQRKHDLVGFQPLEDEHVIDDWSLLFPDSTREEREIPPPGQKRRKNDNSDGKKRLQFAYKIDTSVVDPLANLPDAIEAGVGASLILRNLKRGRMFEMPSGQLIARCLNKPQLDAERHLRTRQEAARTTRNDPSQFEFVPIDDAFKKLTPLWFYILAEAQAPMLDVLAAQDFKCDERFLLEHPLATGAQLGWVGGTIVLETFHGLLDSDPGSYRNHPEARAWRPMIKKFRMWDLVNCNFV